MKYPVLLALCAACVAAPALAQSPFPTGAKVYFIEPANGAAVTGKVTVKFGLSGLGVAPAGVEKEKTGHHHILVDIDVPKDADLEAPLQADDNYRHFGGGQTETLLELKPGTHTLQLLVGDHNHIPHAPPLMSEKITVTVK